MEWQPIETAPKRESIILYSDAWGSFEGAWWRAWYGDRNKQGWMPANLDEEYGEYVEGVTHWMPLPPPPAGA